MLAFRRAYRRLLRLSRCLQCFLVLARQQRQQQGTRRRAARSWTRCLTVRCPAPHAGPSWTGCFRRWAASGPPTRAEAVGLARLPAADRLIDILIARGVIAECKRGRRLVLVRGRP